MKSPILRPQSWPFMHDFWAPWPLFRPEIVWKRIPLAIPVDLSWSRLHNQSLSIKVDNLRATSAQRRWWLPESRVSKVQWKMLVRYLKAWQRKNHKKESQSVKEESLPCIKSDLKIKQGNLHSSELDRQTVQDNGTDTSVKDLQEWIPIAFKRLRINKYKLIQNRLPSIQKKLATVERRIVFEPMEKGYFQKWKM